MAGETRDAILEAAKRSVQAHGYGALSFRDLASEVGVKSASVHYHFPTKGHLGAVLARNYTNDGRRYLDELFASARSIGACMESYTAVFRAALENDNRMCLCGIMAAEHDQLPEEVRAEVKQFIQMNVEWLSKVLAREFPHAARDANEKRALAIFASIEGAQLVARGQGDIAAYDRAIDAYRTAGLIP